MRLAIDAIRGGNWAGEARFGDPDGWLALAEQTLEVTGEFENLRVAGLGIVASTAENEARENRYG